MQVFSVKRCKRMEIPALWGYHDQLSEMLKTFGWVCLCSRYVKGSLRSPVITPVYDSVSTPFVATGRPELHFLQCASQSMTHFHTRHVSRSPPISTLFPLHYLNKPQAPISPCSHQLENRPSDTTTHYCIVVFWSCSGTLRDAGTTARY